MLLALPLILRTNGQVYLCSINCTVPVCFMLENTFSKLCTIDTGRTTSHANRSEIKGNKVDIVP